jgi:hypothetical protein
MNESQQKALLLEKLEEIFSLLEACGELHWFAWIRNDADDLRNGKLHSIQHFLSAFGGMGSFNDLYLCLENGHKIPATGRDEINAMLSELSSESYNLAKSLSSSLSRATQ